MWIEKGLIFSWFYYVVFAIAEKEAATLSQFDAGRVVLASLGEVLTYMTALSYPILAVALVFTLLFVRQEYFNRDRMSVAKIPYVTSILVLYEVLFRLLVIGYVVFGFSTRWNILRWSISSSKRSMPGGRKRNRSWLVPSGVSGCPARSLDSGLSDCVLLLSYGTNKRLASISSAAAFCILSMTASSGRSGALKWARRWASPTLFQPHNGFGGSPFLDIICGNPIH